MPREIVHLGLEAHIHPEALGALLEDVEQRLAGESGEAVAARGQDLSLVVDLDVVPVREALGDGLVALAVGLGEVMHGGVGEDHAEAKGVVAAVALEDGDLVGGIGLLQQDGQVQPSRPAADANDLQQKSRTHVGPPKPRAESRGAPASPGRPERTGGLGGPFEASHYNSRVRLERT